MATEQPEGSAPSVESRMAAFFGAPEPEVAAEPEAVAEEVPVEEEPKPEEEAAPESDVEDLDVDGEIYKVPPSLKAKVSEWKEGALRREDYTRKTQDLADLHRQAQTMAEAITLRQQFDTEVSKEKDELARVTSTLEQYKQIDWQNIEVENYIKLRGQMDSLKERASELNQAINSKAKELARRRKNRRRRLFRPAWTTSRSLFPTSDRNQCSQQRPGPRTPVIPNRNWRTSTMPGSPFSRGRHLSSTSCKAVRPMLSRQHKRLPRL